MCTGGQKCWFNLLSDEKNAEYEISPKTYIEEVMETPDFVLERVMENLADVFGITWVSRGQLSYHMNRKCKCARDKA